MTTQHTFFENSVLWLDGWTVAANMTGDPTYMDALALDIDGALPHPDFYGGRPSRIKVGGPIRQVQVAWVVQDVYQGMINKLQSLGYLENVLLFYYPYDWRKDWAHTDSDLAATIDAVLQRTQMDKVILMAHSTGGLVARNYLLHYGAAKVDQLITMGTPYLGSPMIAKYLEAGDDMKAHLQPGETWWLAQNFLGLYQLLPQPTWFTAADQDGVFPYYLVRSRVDANLGTVYDPLNYACLLYTSDAADERSSVDLGGRRIIKKKKHIRTQVGHTTHTTQRTKHTTNRRDLTHHQFTSDACTEIIGK